MPRREPECNRTNKNTPTHLPVLELGENSKRVLPSVVASIVAGIITALVVHSSSVGSVLGRVYPMGIAIGGTNIAINSSLKWNIS